MNKLGSDCVTPEIKFDPWDWLGVHCGGYFCYVDQDIIGVLQNLRDGEPTDAHLVSSVLHDLVCTLLCNTDAFAFDDDPTQLRFVGDDRFQTLDQLIEAWDTWYGEHYG